MGNQQYTPEFKDEAVRQVVERGYPVKEVAARLGVSSHMHVKPATRRWDPPAQATSRELRNGVKAGCR